MASTFLVRLKIGSTNRCKGVNLLYRSKLKLKYVWALIATALFPVLILNHSLQVFNNLALDGIKNETTIADVIGWGGD
ncbi:SteA C-terminal domain-containing protein [Paraclostridium bifermentans]|nr:SteA C-terminal domain-containing protein [Paraclostridium bifermentans]